MTRVVDGLGSSAVRAFVVVAGGLLVLLALAEPAAALQSAPGRGMRDFWHVFVAYGIAWLLLMGWMVATFRRLGRVEKQLQRKDSEAGAP